MRRSRGRPQGFPDFHKALHSYFIGLSQRSHIGNSRIPNHTTWSSHTIPYNTIFPQPCDMTLQKSLSGTTFFTFSATDLKIRFSFQCVRKGLSIHNIYNITGVSICLLHCSSQGFSYDLGQLIYDLLRGLAGAARAIHIGMLHSENPFHRKFELEETL